MFNDLPLASLDIRRKALGMSRSALARRSGVSLPTVQRILSGAEAMPSLPALHAIAVALGVQVTLGQRPVIAEAKSAAEFRRQQAVQKARRLSRMVQGTMALEAQGVEQATLDAITEQHVLELLAGPSRRLWDD